MITLSNDQKKSYLTCWVAIEYSVSTLSIKFYFYSISMPFSHHWRRITKNWYVNTELPVCSTVTKNFDQIVKGLTVNIFFVPINICNKKAFGMFSSIQLE